MKGADHVTCTLNWAFSHKDIRSVTVRFTRTAQTLLQTISPCLAIPTITDPYDLCPNANLHPQARHALPRNLHLPPPLNRSRCLQPRSSNHWSQEQPLCRPNHLIRRQPHRGYGPRNRRRRLFLPGHGHRRGSSASRPRTGEDGHGRAEEVDRWECARDGLCELNCGWEGERTVCAVWIC